MSSKKCLKISLAVVALLLVGAIIAVIVLAVNLNNANNETTPEPEDPGSLDRLYARINCFPEYQETFEDAWPFSKQDCLDRGCLYESTYGVVGVPTCYLPTDSVGYRTKRVVVNQRSGSILYESLLEPLSNFQLFDPAISNVKFTVQAVTNQHLRIKIEDADYSRYEVPFRSHSEPGQVEANNPDYTIEVTESPFSIQVRRKSTQKLVFDTSLGGFIFSDRFLQISTRLPSIFFYGLGEHEHPSLLHDMNYKTWPIFSREQAGLGEGYGLYGTHPFYMSLEVTGEAHGVFLLNSNAMEYALIPAPGVVIRSIGGIFDFHIYLGPTPENVVQQHTEFVGRPYFPPYWSLGFHLSRYGYGNKSEMQAAVDRTRWNSIPLEAIYADIDTMDGRRDFTLDSENFGDMPAYFEEEKQKNGLRSVVILDPPITNNETDGEYEPWQLFNGNDSFVKWKNGSNMFGYVWPVGQVAFPDFFLKRTQDVWSYLIEKHSKKIPFDGVWIDMNEPTNFGTNDPSFQDYPPHMPQPDPSMSLTCPIEGLDNPPYRTRAVTLFDTPERTVPLCEKSLCLEANQMDGNYTHYDVHSLYGWSQTFATHEALKKTYPDRRPFLLTRSTFAGSGSVASHWLGDNVASWKDMSRSIIGILEMSMFGIAHTGADICGFIGTPSEELCKRWTELGAFYPFSRNHNDYSAAPQDPGYFGGDVATQAHAFIDTRYLMIPYLYTQFYEAHTSGKTVARPMFFEFIDDKATWSLDKQFMLGPDFMVIPILEPDIQGVYGYVPRGIWWSYEYSDSFHDFCSGPANHHFSLNTGGALLQRGGSIVAFQHTGNSWRNITYRVISTATTRKEHMFIQVLYDCDGKASGKLFWDDGESPNTIEQGKYWLIEYTSSYNETTLVYEAKVVHNSTDETLAEDLYYNMFFLSNIPEINKFEVSCSSTQCPRFIKAPYSASTKTHIFQITGKKGLLVPQDWSMIATFY